MTGASWYVLSGWLAALRLRALARRARSRAQRLADAEWARVAPMAILAGTFLEYDRSRRDGALPPRSTYVHSAFDAPQGALFRDVIVLGTFWERPQINGMGPVELYDLIQKRIVPRGPALV